MPSGWSVDYSTDAAYYEGTGAFVYTSPGGSPESSVTAKPVELSKADIEAGWSPAVEKFVVFGDDFEIVSGGTFTFDSNTYSVLGVQRRNDDQQWFVYGQQNA